MEFIRLTHISNSVFEKRSDEELARFLAEDVLRAAEAMGILSEIPEPTHTDDDARYFFGNTELPKPREGW